MTPLCRFDNILHKSFLFLRMFIKIRTPLGRFLIKNYCDRPKWRHLGSRGLRNAYRPWPSVLVQNCIIGPILCTYMLYKIVRNYFIIPVTGPNYIYIYLSIVCCDPVLLFWFISIRISPRLGHTKVYLNIIFMSRGWERLIPQASQKYSSVIKNKCCMGGGGAKRALRIIFSKFQAYRIYDS